MLISHNLLSVVVCDPVKQEDILAGYNLRFIFGNNKWQVTGSGGKPGQPEMLGRWQNTAEMVLETGRREGRKEGGMADGKKNDDSKPERTTDEEHQ